MPCFKAWNNRLWSRKDQSGKQKKKKKELTAIDKPLGKGNKVATSGIYRSAKPTSLTDRTNTGLSTGPEADRFSQKFIVSCSHKNQHTAVLVTLQGPSWMDADRLGARRVKQVLLEPFSLVCQENPISKCWAPG